MSNHPADLALKASRSWPTQEQMDAEGFCMAHFYSELQCRIMYLMEVHEPTHTRIQAIPVLHTALC